MPNVPEPVSSAHLQNLFLLDHQDVDEHAGKTIVAKAFENYQFKDPPGYFNGEAGLLASDGDVGEDEIVKGL
eukprot:CAMPEP_0170458394 /NCGR_PEP_ID=MMETSP0123-20130129/5373_1 /TAXON_ID=182087 /ORGANISM="Favella ehrenbergii, Strain Fehren 1" /LENGTH=71 /DNA_ID=CAMNT_0010722517 /DNA_START=356 /DNA_END=571 /DNA_ORIENTATION=+